MASSSRSFHINPGVASSSTNREQTANIESNSSTANNDDNREEIDNPASTALNAFEKLLQATQKWEKSKPSSPKKPGLNFPEQQQQQQRRSDQSLAHRKVADPTFGRGLRSGEKEAEYQLLGSIKGEGGLRYFEYYYDPHGEKPGSTLVTFVRQDAARKFLEYCGGGMKVRSAPFSWNQTFKTGGELLPHVEAWPLSDKHYWKMLKENGLSIVDGDYGSIEEVIWKRGATRVLTISPAVEVGALLRFSMFLDELHEDHKFTEQN
ncbi:hypothetical protein RUND412_004030 [Rhizina undulata]